MKKIVALSLVIFAVIAAGLLYAGLAPRGSRLAGEGSEHGDSTNRPAFTVATSSDQVQEGRSISMEEIAKHDSMSDCWVIIEGSVYDVTGFLNRHPGQPEAIAPYCGKDATQGFETKNKPTLQEHSARADATLVQLKIGELQK